MKEHPILFKTEMVEAILSGSKTQTRRVVKLPEGFSIQKPEICREVSPSGARGRWGVLAINADPDLRMPEVKHLPCPYGGMGDRLWVRETWQPNPNCDDDEWDKHNCSYYEWSGCGSNPSNLPSALQKPEHCIYQASFNGQGLKWKPSLHMPRWASRLLLEIVDINIERLQDISEADSAAEGMGSPITRDCKKPAFIRLWKSINGEESWNSNPWVWVVKFKVIDPDGQQ